MLNKESRNRIIKWKILRENTISSVSPVPGPWTRLAINLPIQSKLSKFSFSNIVKINPQSTNNIVIVVCYFAEEFYDPTSNFLPVSSVRKSVTSCDKLNPVWRAKVTARANPTEHAEVRALIIGRTGSASWMSEWTTASIKGDKGLKIFLTAFFRRILSNLSNFGRNATFAY